MKLKILIFYLFIILSIQLITGANYYCDPVNGSLNNDGLSVNSPWPSLQQAISTKSFAGGDTIYLMSGNHGSPYINKSFSEDVVLTKFPNEQPVIKFIVFSGASHWKLDSLTISSEGIRVRFDPPLEHPVYPIKDNSLIQITDNSSNITIENCFIASVENSSEWTKDDWNYKAWNGINSVNNSDVIIRNCHLKNINFGINNSSNSKNNLYEYNIIENFSGDALRGHGTNTVIQYNVVKNAYNTNGNHDDMLQAFSGNPVGLVIRGNIFVAYTDPSQPFKSKTQGIGCFDGMFYDFIIENNIVATSHWHGITLLGAVNSKIINNTVVDLDNTDSSKPWIMIDDHKNGTPSSNCIIRNNITPTIKKGAGVTSDHNLLVPYSQYDTYFADFENLDLRLKQGSPAVNAGSEAGAPSVDILGNPRPQGEGYDIGAYEYRETTTSIEEIESEPATRPKFFPNPTSGPLRFEFPETFKGKITISDMTGKTVIEKKVYARNGTLDLSEYKRGIYFVHVGEDIKSWHQIIVKL
jgi:hypothetical protein